MSTVLVPEATIGMEMYEESGILFSDFTDGGAAVGTYQVGFTLPVGFFVWGCILADVTGFTGDVSAAITVGDGSDVDRYNAGTPSVFTTIDSLYLGIPAGTRSLAAENRPTLTVTVDADWGSVTAGTLTIRVYGWMT